METPHREIWTPNQYNHVFLTLREKDIPNYCIMATPKYDKVTKELKGYFVYWTNADKMDDNSDKSEHLSVEETVSKFKPLGPLVQLP